jgi:osomolarity two-component system response regulator SKN7
VADGIWQAWEFKHPDFKMNNKDALDNIRRKAPAARKPTTTTDDQMIPTQQIDMLNSQLVATQQQLQHLTEKNTELSIQNSMMIQELIGLQKTVVNHEQILHNVVNFLNDFEARRRRDSRSVFPQTSEGGPSATLGATQTPLQSAENDDSPPSPLQHASKLLSETNVDVMLNNRNLEHMNEMSLRMNGSLITTPPPDVNHRGGGRASAGSAPHSAGSSGSMRFSELDTLVYPVGQNNGIDPMYSEHIHNIPYSTPVKQQDSGGQVRAVGDKKGKLDPGWVRKPHILLVEDDVTCRRIGTKFLLAFSCSVTTAVIEIPYFPSELV